MFLINALTDKQKRIKSEDEMISFLSNYSNAEDILRRMLKDFKKGNIVYWAENPFVAEIEKQREILVGKNREDVKNIFYTLREEV